MKKTGPICTKGTKQTSDKAADIRSGGRNMAPARTWPKGTNPMPTKHGFMPNRRETC